MDPIRPIGPIERDIDPVVRITRTSPDGGREQGRGEPDQPPRRKPAPPSPTVPGPEDTGDGGPPPSLIDIKV
jgi:hypothetical protein